MKSRCKIYCVGCSDDVDAELVSGKEVYPHRPDLANIPFWRCPECHNFVGCHYKSANPTRPLGVIATKELKSMRMAIHRQLDSMWRVNGRRNKKLRGEIYRELSERLGVDYHTGNIQSEEDAHKVLNILNEMKGERNEDNNI